MNKTGIFKKNFLILLLFIILIIIFTYPLAFRIKACIPGFEGTDEPYWTLWFFWWLKYSFMHKLNPGFCPIIAAPFGINYGASLYPVTDFINKFLALCLGVIGNYNFQAILSILLSAVFIYFLVYKITKETLAAVFSGIIYAFCPYHMIRIWQHLSLAQIEWLAFYSLLLCRLKESNSLRNAVFAGAGFSLVAFFDLYYAYFAVIISVVFVLSVLFAGGTGSKMLKYICLVVVIAFLMVIPLVFPAAKQMSGLTSVSDWGFQRPFEHLFSQSARPLSYFLPATTHPFLGKFTESFVGSPLYGISLTEHTLYLGWIPLLFAFLAFRKWSKNQRAQEYPLDYAQGRQSTRAQDIINERFYISFFIFLAIVAWSFSQPPWWQIGPLKIYMPSFFMYKLLPMFRAYCRFGIVVMLAVSVLAGFGLKFILGKFRSSKSKIFITSLFCGLVLFEFWNWPPFKVIDVSRVPQVYYWLREQPGDFTIAEYPLDAVAPDQMYRFYQITHEKKIINSTVPGTTANNLAKTITELSQEHTAGILKWMQVKYVIVHRDRYLDTELVKDKEELAKIPDNKGLRFIKIFPTQGCPEKNIMCIQKSGPIDVYEVAASPIKPEI